MNDLNKQSFNAKGPRIMTSRKFTAGLVAIALLTVVPALAGSHEKTEKSKDIVDTAVAAGSFNTLVAAVQAAGLVDALKADGPLTVFAPTDEAFAKLPEGTVETLLLPENIDQLKSILTYHVVAGKILSTDLSDGATATTLQGSNLSVEIADGIVSIQNANVTTADISTSNGVIHVIDTVLLPQ
jgi:uncharacterized surface protein with fasciclin (FAS1) repeats